MKKAKSTWFDLVIIITFIIVSFFWSLHYLNQQQDKPTFYQFHFEPAVLVACGHDFGLLKKGSNRALQNFLDSKTNTFSCQQLPKDLTINHHAAIKGWYYMLMSIAMLWKITGISWSAINILFAAFFSLTLLAAYGIYRLGMNPILALLGIILFALLPIHHSVLLSFRDYNRTPFILFGILILAYMAIKPISWRKRFLLTTILAIITAIGYGFRPDVIVLIPATLVTLAFFLPNTKLRHWWKNISLILYFCIITISVALPVLTTYRSPEIGSCIYHFPTLGLASQFQQELNVKADDYDWIYKFSDEFTYSTIATYGKHFLDMKKVIPCSRDYDKASQAYYWSIVKNFPGTMLSRGLNSIIHIIGWPILSLSLMLIIILSLFNLRLALFLSLGLIYFFSYPSIQFLQKHFFYLLLWSWWPIGFILQQIYTYIFNQQGFVIRHEKLTWMKRNPIKIRKKIYLCSYSLLAIIVVLLGAYLTAHYYQADRLLEIKRAYLAAPSKKLPYVFVTHQSGNRRLAKFIWPKSWLPLKGKQYHQGRVHGIMLRVQLGTKACQAHYMTYQLLYHTNKPWYDFSVKLQANLAHAGIGNYIVFMPVYFNYGELSPHGIAKRQANDTSFSYPYGIELPSDYFNCLNSIRIVETQALPPVWLSLFLSPEPSK